jgi:hypothetical protein
VRRWALGGVLSLALVAAACGSASKPIGTPPPTMPPPNGRSVLVTTTAGEPSHQQALTVQVGTVVKLRLLTGTQHISVVDTADVRDRSILATWPLQPGDGVDNAATSNFIAVRPGRTTVVATIGTTTLTLTVTVTRTAPASP